MSRAIEQSVTFKASPSQLYQFFMDSEKHTAATGMPATVSREVGGKWNAFGGMLSGTNLALIPSRLIVQAWRSKSWKKTDAESILVVRFTKVRQGTRVDLSHIGVPEHDFKGVTKGWKKYYWEPWKKYLTAKK